MNPKEDFQPAYVIHTRAYRETSLLVEFFTANYGRVSAVAKGGRRSKKSRHNWQPFVPMQITWSGGGELKSLRQAETTGAPANLIGQYIYCGMYVNEILYRLLDIHEPIASLFSAYMGCLTALANKPNALQENTVLRKFELQLLAALGYGVSFALDADSATPVQLEQQYEFVLNKGFVAARSGAPVIAGRELMVLEKGPWLASHLKYLKFINRQAIDQLLGHKPLYSRDLYKAAMVKPHNAN